MGKLPLIHPVRHTVPKSDFTFFSRKLLRDIQDPRKSDRNISADIQAACSSCGICPLRFLANILYPMGFSPDLPKNMRLNIDESNRRLYRLARLYTRDVFKSRRLPKKASEWLPLLHDAAKTGSVLLCRFFLDPPYPGFCKNPINLSDKSGNTALHLAVKGGHEAVVKVLLEKGARLEAEDHLGKTPLHWAAENRHTEVLKVLLEKGARLEAEDHLGKTPLHWAAENRHTEALKVLLESGANLDIADKSGNTALHLAAYKGHEGACQVLLESGAKLDIVNKSGNTALHLAKCNQHPHIFFQHARTLLRSNLYKTGTTKAYLKRAGFEFNGESLRDHISQRLSIDELRALKRKYEIRRHLCQRQRNPLKEATT